MKNVWLAHHGILGQKWGVRRYENPDGSLTEAGKKRYNKKRNIEWDKNRSTMDDKELDQALNRLRKENELHRLTQNGNNFAKEALKESGKRIISTVVAGTALYAGKVLVSKVLKNPEMADFVFPGGGKKKKDKGDN